MELRTIQDWIVAPLLKPIAGRERGQQLRRRGQAVPGAASHPEQAPQVRPDRRARWSRRSSAATPTPAAASSCAAGSRSTCAAWGCCGTSPTSSGSCSRPQDGAPVYLRDVADVVIGAEPRQGAVTRDGKGEAVAGMIIMLKGENSQGRGQPGQGGRSGRSRARCPPGVRLNVFYDRTSLIEACIETVVDALLEGGIFVILVLFLFLAELRTALIVVFSLPLTFLVSFIVMGAAGLTVQPDEPGRPGLLGRAWWWTPPSSWWRTSAATSRSAPDRSAKRRDRGRGAWPRWRGRSPSRCSSSPSSWCRSSRCRGSRARCSRRSRSTMLIALLVSLVVALTVDPGRSPTLVLQQAPGAGVRLHPPLPRRATCGCSDRAVRAPAAHARDLAGGAARRRRRAGPVRRHRVHAAARRGGHRDQRRAPAERLARRARWRWPSFMEKRLLAVPGGGDRGQQDRPGRDLRGSDGARADRRLHHAQAAQAVGHGPRQGRAGRGHPAGPGRDPGPALLLLAAHRAAGQRAHLRREERPGRQGLRPRPRRAQELRRPRRRGRDAGVRGRRRRQGRAGLRHEPARRGHRPRGGWRATASTIARRQRRHRDGRRRAHGDHPHRGAAPLRGGRALPGGEPRGDIPRRSSGCSSRPRAASGCRSAQLAERRSWSRRRRRSAARTACAAWWSRPTSAAATWAASSSEVQARLAPAREGAARRATSSSTAASSRTSSGPCGSSPIVVPIALAAHPAPALHGARARSATRCSCCSTCRSRSWAA